VGPLSRAVKVSESNADHDVVWGAKAIGAVINRTERQAFHLLESGALPAKKIGNLWTGSRRKLLAAISGDDASA
jgi:hypothetical protein